MVIIEFFLRTKSDQNIHQDASNCTIKKKILGGGIPPNPLANFKMYSPPPKS